MKLLPAGLTACVILASCSVQDPDRVASSNPGPSLTGSITGGTGKGNLYAVLYDMSSKNAKPLVDQVIAKDRRFEFTVPAMQEFGVGSFEDLNGNLRQDVGEYAGFVKFPKVAPRPAGKSGPVVRRDVSLQKRTRTLANPIVMSEEAAREVAKRQRRPSAPNSSAPPLPTPPSPTKLAGPAPQPVNDVVNLRDARFGMNAAAMGYKDPAAFEKQYGSGLYLVDPYRAMKVPVIFIHGVGGAAQDWQSLFPRLELGRVQPLVYHYPTGIPLAQATDRLEDYADVLSKRYGFRDVQVVGLGSGGLIAQRFAQSARGVRVRSLVTLGTSWGGVNVPSASVQRSHASWDLRDGSPFLKAARKGYGGPHSLIFAYQDGRAVASQLDSSVQGGATRVRGFNTTVRGLAADPGAVAEVNLALRVK